MTIDRYFNRVHGLELEPDVNTGDRKNENGILFLVEYIILEKQSSNNKNLTMFIDVMNNIQVEPGLYDRGGLDRRNPPKRTISHDNISAIAAGSKLLGTKHAKDIADYGVRHAFSYNNNQKGFRFPMNPGNIPIWCALADSYLLLQILFMPIYLINTIICLLKDKQETSGRLLTFIELYPLRNEPFYGTLYKLVMDSFNETYGESPLQHITEIYFRDENHPVRVAARGSKYDE